MIKDIIIHVLGWVLLSVRFPRSASVTGVEGCRIREVTPSMSAASRGTLWVEKTAHGDERESDEPKDD